MTKEDLGDGGFLRPDEQQRMEYALTSLHDIGKEFVEEAKKGDAKAARVVRDMFETTFNGTLKMAELRQKEKSMGEESRKMDIVEGILNMPYTQPTVGEKRIIEVNDDAIPKVIVPGEMAVEKEELNINDFISED